MHISSFFVVGCWLGLVGVIGDVTCVEGVGCQACKLHGCKNIGSRLTQRVSGVRVSISRAARVWCAWHNAHKLCLTSRFEFPSRTEITSSWVRFFCVTFSKREKHWVTFWTESSQVHKCQLEPNKHHKDVDVEWVRHSILSQSGCRIMSAQHEWWCNYDDGSHHD